MSARTIVAGVAAAALSVLAPASSRAEASFAPYVPQVTTAKLENGLEVVFAPNARTTDIAVAIAHRAGKADEPRRGVWQMFRRLAYNFVGTKNMSIAAIERAMSEDGLRVTWPNDGDVDVVYATGPSSQLGRAIWQISEPMASLFDGMTQAEYERARNAIAADLRQKKGSEPHQELQARLFPPGHPYHRPAAAPDEEIATLSFEDAKRIHRACLVPNATTVVVAGNFDRARAEELVRKYLGVIPSSGATSPCRKAVPAKLPEPQPAELVYEASGRDAQVEMQWSAPAVGEADDLALDVAAFVLANRLDDRLVDNMKIAKSVVVQEESRPVQSVFFVRAHVAPGRTTAEVKRAIEEELTRVSRDGFSSDEITAGKRRLQAHAIDLEQPGTLAGRLVFASVHPDGVASLSRAVDRYAALDGVQVATAVRKWLVPARRVGLVIESRPGAPREGRLVGGKR